MKGTKGESDGSIGECGGVSVIPNELKLRVVVVGESDTNFVFKNVRFGVVKEPPQFYIVAGPPEAAETGFLRIKGLGLKDNTSYVIDTGDKDVQVDLEIEGITEYTTPPKGIFNVIKFSEETDIKQYLVGSFRFEMYDALGQQKTILVTCSQFEIELSD